MINNSQSLQPTYKIDLTQVWRLTIFFLIILQLNSYLLVSVYDGAQIVRQVEADVGHSLSCFEAYHHREINNYFYPQYSFRGNLIYFFSIFNLFWVFGSLILALGLSIKWKSGGYYRWLPIILMSAVVIALMANMSMIQTISCAID